MTRSVRKMLYMGLDVGTQGVRCVVADEGGVVWAAQSVAFGALNAAEVEGWYEQRPEDWRAAAEEAIRACTSQLGRRAEEIRAVAVDGTSGTIVPLDADFAPLCRGVMYNDPRAKAEAAAVHAAMGAHEARLGLKFGASFSLPRILWFYRNRPELCAETRVFAHQADYVSGMLSGECAVTDESNALKTGYDVLGRFWPETIERLGMELSKLPRVVRSGERIGRVTAEAAARTGLSTKTWVVGGSTDGCASAMSAGAVRAGDWASIIGTTFVLKGVTEHLVLDPDGACYSHRLPSGEWMLGGAGNIGGRCMNLARGGRSFDELNRESVGLIPTGARCYPLVGRGERFPFVDPNFEAFYFGDILSGKLYPAMMEGVGFAERLAFERVQALGCQVGDTVCTAGGVCRSELWLRIRAAILNRRLAVPRVVDAAMGMAMLAAAGDFGSLSAAARDMIQYEKIVEPEAELSRRYDEIYRRFEAELNLVRQNGRNQ